MNFIISIAFSIAISLIVTALMAVIAGAFVASALATI